MLENGCVAEIGSHEELMAQKGKYYKLFSTQASRYQTKDGEETMGLGVPPMGERPPVNGEGKRRFPMETGFPPAPRGIKPPMHK